jgi:hypothetical protein
METPPISIVIVNYRSAARLARLLASLPAQDGRYSVIVANNDPSESRVLQELGKTFPFLLIETGANRGFAAGANAGALAASGDIIGFINPDTLWSDVSFETIRSLFETNPTTGIIGLSLTEQDGTPEAYSFGHDPSLIELIRNNTLRNHPSAQPEKKLVATDWVSGGALFIRKDLFQKLGGFDERFFLYFEDADLCRRARLEGAAVRLASHLPIIHIGGQSQESKALQKGYFYTSQSAYFRKHRPRVEYYALRLLRFLRYGL